MIDLILKEIEDVYTRENFSRIHKFIEKQAILAGNFKIFDKYFTSQVSNFNFEHDLGFIPRDYLILSIKGNQNVYFDPEKFTKSTINITVAGPCRVRFLVGAFSEDLVSGANDLLYVPPSIDTNVDGGFANSVYLPIQLVDGGGA